MTRIAFIFLLSSVFGFVNNLFAQNDSLGKIDFSVLAPKPLFCSKNELGGLIGIGNIRNPNDYQMWNPDWALELTSTNGIRYAPWFLGIGVGVRTWGIDFTFPVFGHVSLDLYKTGLFLHADMGHQFGVRKNYFGDRETGSFYAAYGLGYNFSIKRQALYVKASICHQKTKAADEQGGLGPSNYPEHYDPTYLFCRISLGLTFTK